MADMKIHISDSGMGKMMWFIPIAILISTRNPEFYTFFHRLRTHNKATGIMHKSTNKDYYPFDIILRGILMNFHREILLAKRWDLTVDSRLTLRLGQN